MNLVGDDLLVVVAILQRTEKVSLVHELALVKVDLNDYPCLRFVLHFDFCKNILVHKNGWTNKQRQTGGKRELRQDQNETRG